MIGTKVKELRLQLRMSQEDVAREAGVSRPTISHIERHDKVRVREDTLYGLAEALGVKPSVLLGEPPEPKKPKHTMLSEQEQRRDLESLLSTLDEPMRKVLELRFGLADGRIRTFKEVGGELNLSHERIRQIEDKAVRMLRHPARRELLEQLIGLHDKGVRKLLSSTGLYVSLKQAAIFAQCHPECLVELKQAGEVKTHNKCSTELYSLRSLASVKIQPRQRQECAVCGQPMPHSHESVERMLGIDPVLSSVCKDSLLEFSNLGILYENKDVYVAVPSETLESTPRRPFLENLEEGQYIVAKKNPAIFQGKIYLVKHQNKLTVRHYYRIGDKVRLVSISGYEEAHPTTIEILGQVILMGTWRKY